MFVPSKSANWILIAGIVAAVIVASLWFLKSKFYKSTKLERTVVIIKPDAVSAGHSGKIIDKIEQSGFKIISMKKFDLTKEKAEELYATHKDKPFFNDLIQFMISGPIVAMIIEKENAVQAWRDLAGDTDPQKAANDTLRKMFGTDITKNAVHGSDTEENAKFEISKLFPDLM